MEWTGTVDLSGTKPRGMRLVTTTPAQVFIDGALVAAAQGAIERQTVETEITGHSGRVPILVRTFRSAGGEDWSVWKLQLLWRGPAGEWTASARYEPPRAEIEPRP
jgi:hypothetical protein